MSIYISGIAETYRIAGVIRFRNWWGINLFDKSVLIWGVRATDKTNNSILATLKKKFRNRYDINVFELNEKEFLKFYNDIESFKPFYIRGYKSGILQFAELLEKLNLRFKSFEFKVAIVTSEVLLDEERRYIERVLNCKVANEYGAAEGGLYAYECDEGSMHIFEEAVYIFTNNNNIAITTELYNDHMPLINYQIGDKLYISNHNCKCGRTLRLIDQIQGRMNDVVICTDGREVSQYIFYYIINELNDIGLENAIKKYKIVQNHNHFEFFIIPGNNYHDTEIKEYILKRMNKEIGKDITVDFNLVKSIPREESGKLRFFIREK